MTLAETEAKLQEQARILGGGWRIENHGYRPVIILDMHKAQELIDKLEGEVVADKKYMTIKEFREEGYLQELNRCFLHPLGLAIEVTILADGTERLGQVWDSRDDPEGIIFGEGVIELPKVDNVYNAMQERAHQRVAALGYLVQPADEQRLP